MRGHDTIRHMWPSEASTEAFVNFIRREYDATQQAAIEVCNLLQNVPCNATVLTWQSCLHVLHDYSKGKIAVQLFKIYLGHMSTLVLRCGNATCQAAQCLSGLNALCMLQAVQCNVYCIELCASQPYTSWYSSERNKQCKHAAQRVL